MPLYKRSPITVDAMRWTGDNWETMVKFLGSKVKKVYTEGDILFFETHENRLLRCDEGCYVIHGDNPYPCPPDVFMRTYEIHDRFTVEDDFLSEDYNRYTRPWRDENS